MSLCSRKNSKRKLIHAHPKYMSINFHPHWFNASANEKKGRIIYSARVLFKQCWLFELGLAQHVSDMCLLLLFSASAELSWGSERKSTSPLSVCHTLTETLLPQWGLSKAATKAGWESSLLKHAFILLSHFIAHSFVGGINCHFL